MQKYAIIYKRKCDSLAFMHDTIVKRSKRYSTTWFMYNLNYHFKRKSKYENKVWRLTKENLLCILLSNNLNSNIAFCKVLYVCTKRKTGFLQILYVHVWSIYIYIYIYTRSEHIPSDIVISYILSKTRRFRIERRFFEYFI